MWQNPVPAGTPFWATEATKLAGKLESAEAGLSSVQVRERLQPLRRESAMLRELKLFFVRFRDPILLLLLLAVLISALMGELGEAAIILSILIASASLTYLLHSHAGRMVEKLEAMVLPDCRVKRQGKITTIPSWKLVPGDRVLLRAGDLVPADCFLLEANELHANESGFTGESFPVRKFPGMAPVEARLQERHNCLWAGSNIVSGNGEALAVHIRGDALFGAMVKTAGGLRITGFEAGLQKFGMLLLRITLMLSLLVLLIHFFRGFSLMQSAMFSLALAVGMAPELLPAITSMAMSIGAGRLLEKDVLVKDIQAIQNLGEISLLCTDKTGTLTEGKIQVAGFRNIDGSEDEFVRHLACLNASLATGYANPMEDALRRISPEKVSPELKTGEVPYDFIRKRVGISVKNASLNRIICKGAFSEMMECCQQVRFADGSIKEINPFRKKLQDDYRKYGESGMRCLLVAFRDTQNPGMHKKDEHSLILAGFALFQDPVKESALKAIHSLQIEGVGLKILSGDSPHVLRSLGPKIGIPNPRILTGKEIDHTSPQALRHQAEETDFFAELEPRHKERVIQVLRRKHVLAYMGDGINDVTALHAADVGISVNNAAGIAIDAADFVLLRKDISVLAEGIREGRKTFSNTLKYIYITTGATFGNMLSVALASLFLPFIPMLPKQILLTNFISDFPFLAVASDRVDEEQIRLPGHWQIGLIRNFMLVFGLHSSLFDFLTFSFLYYFVKVPKAQFQTAWFMESVLTEILILFVIRTQRPFFRSRPAFPLLLLGLLAIFFTVLLPWLPFASPFGFVPLPPNTSGGILLILAGYIISADLLKSWFFRSMNRT